MKKKSYNISLITSIFSGEGGTERALINLANNLSKHYNVKIISVFTTDIEKANYPISSKVEIIHLGLGKYNFLYRIYKIFFLLKKLIKTDDFVIGQVPFINILLGFYKILNLIPTKCKTIGIEHIGYFSVKKTTRILSLYFYRYIDAIAPLTEYSALQFHKRGLYNTEVIPNAVSFKSIETSTCTSNIILSVGRMSSQKNFVYLIETLEETLKKYPSWQLHIVGGVGDETQNIYDVINKLQLENSVIVENFTPNISEKYLSASIFALASKYEGFPMVLIEAKAFGLPIVAHNCLTGPKEIIKANDGILTPYMDSKAFSKAIEELILNKEKRILFGTNAIENAKEYNFDAILKKWEDLFNKLKNE